MPKIKNLAVGFIVSLTLTTNLYAQEKSQLTYIPVPDYSSWNVKSFQVDLDGDGAIDLTFNIYYAGDNIIQIWLDRYNQERVLTVTKSYKFIGSAPTSNYFKINNLWILSRGTDRKPIKSEELIKASKLLVKDLGGDDNFNEAISRLTFLMYQIPW